MRKLAILLLLVILLSSIGMVAQQSCPTPTGTLLKTTSYSPLAADVGKTIVMNCVTLPCTVTLPKPPQSLTWLIWVSNSLRATVPLTISPNGLQIDQAPDSLSLFPGSGVMITTDGSNYFTGRGFGVNADPPSDIRRYGGRAISYVSPPGIPGITTTINVRTNPKLAILSAPSSFINGDGATIWFAGPAPTMTTPTPPTVTASVATSETGTGFAVANGSGSTTYSYKIRAVDVGRGTTAPSIAVTITNGAARLGSNHASIASCLRTGSVVTIQTATAHGLVLPAMVQLDGITLGGALPGQVNTGAQNDFFGPQTVASVPDPTHFTYIGNPNTALGQATACDPNTGTVTWYNENYLKFAAPGPGVWQYYIYGRTTAAYNLIGVTHPAISGVYGNGQEIYWEDYGSPMMDGTTLPGNIPLTDSASATNDNLTTTICGGAGTTALTLCDAANSSVTNSTILFDDAPAIKKAYATATFNYGMLSFPAPNLQPANHVGYVTNSFLDLTAGYPAPLSFGGYTQFNDTVYYNGTWYGDLQPTSHATALGCPQFSIDCHNPVGLGGNPGVVTSTGTTTHGLTFYGNGGNAQVLFFGIPLKSTSFYDTTLYTANHSDYMGVGVYLLCQDNPGGCASDIYFRQNLWYPGPQQIVGLTSTPFIQLKNTGGIYVDGMFGAIRGMFILPNQSGMQLDYNQKYETQGPITPAITIFASSAYQSVKIRSAIMDTSFLPVVASIGSPSTPAGTLEFEHGYSNNISGQPWGYTKNAGNGSGQNGDWDYPGVKTFTTNMSMGPLSSFFTFPGVIPAAPTCAQGGAGIIAAGTYHFSYQATYPPNNGYGRPSLISSACIADGSHNIDLTIPAGIPGASGYVFYFADSPYGSGVISCNTPATTGLTFTVSTSFCSGAQPSPPTGGPTGFAGTKMWSAYMQLVPQKFSAIPSCTAALAGNGASVSDSTTQVWGATITGGGGLFALAMCDGTAWTVVGK